MNFLRTISTRRLVAWIAGLALAGGGGTAFALAASSGGPVPPAKPLDVAVRDALNGPSVPGITARIKFTNHLIDAASLQGTDPILSGGSGRVWLSGNGRFRLEVQSDNGDAQVVSDGKAFWVYDPSSRTVYRGAVPQGHDRDGDHGPPTLAEIRDTLRRITANADLSGATPGNVAGRPAYTVKVSPQHSAGLVGSAQLAWDAARGVPLRVAIYARGSGSPALELRVTDISYGAVPASDFAISPPPGAKVVRVDVPMADRHGTPVTGKATVAKRVGFPLAAPDTLVGLPRQEVRLLDWNGTPAALVTYGRNLGGIAVIEQRGDASGASMGTGDLSLPKVSIDGATGEELDTALGTMVRFDRAGVSYTVLTSGPPAAAEAAARGL
jgi:outer membrane lipoprotein-sorting protein